MVFKPPLFEPANTKVKTILILIVKGIGWLNTFSNLDLFFTQLDKLLVTFYRLLKFKVTFEI